ncbi:hypothetical protein BDW02DRAFT_286095 [Decorospora gaudefroyi]|uniref:Uncharacterized protein n=1 Tax=Decorospora gaudefroyi TaxID=184978 RepID=A0A6A5KIQ7_9PLEO|nr:hypothetical protein BDW02DRAFT_286095 [Decorospora gaudefroyi]
MTCSVTLRTSEICIHFRRIDPQSFGSQRYAQGTPSDIFDILTPAVPVQQPKPFRSHPPPTCRIPRTRRTPQPRICPLPLFLSHARQAKVGSRMSRYEHRTTRSACTPRQILSARHHVGNAMQCVSIGPPQPSNVTPVRTLAYVTCCPLSLLAFTLLLR